MCESIGHRPLRGRCPKSQDFVNYQRFWGCQLGFLERIGPPKWGPQGRLIMFTAPPYQITVTLQQIYTSNNNKAEITTKKSKFWSFLAICLILGPFKSPWRVPKGLTSPISQFCHQIYFNLDQFQGSFSLC